MRFCSLGSGSAGNATLVEYYVQDQVSRVLLDCGMPLKQLTERLLSKGLSPAQLDAVFITHEHSDHIGCARQLAVQHQIPVWMSRGTYHAIGRPDLGGTLRLTQCGDAIGIGSLTLQPFAVPHDAKEPLQVVISSGEHRLALLTDLGHVSQHVLAQLKELDALILECNHDPDMLQASRYPPFLKVRVGGAYGHLSNEQAMDCLVRIASPRLKHVVAAHLSEQNNSDDLVRSGLLRAVAKLGLAAKITIANATSGFEWIEL